MTPRMCLVLAGLMGALGIALGSFGTHALPGILKNRGVVERDLPEREKWFETGVRYHLVHALAMLALAAAGTRPWPNSFGVASVCWLVGILIFPGCLYAMALSGVRVLGAIVPLGGVAFIIGWTAVVVGAWSTQAQ